MAQLPLVEVIRSSFNADADVAKGASFALAIGKSPVVVKSAPGFLVNRVLMPYMLGAVERVEKGESKELLDAAAVAFGMPMGPIELMDTVGLDVGASVARGTWPQPCPRASRFASLVAAKKLGRKTGEGFYKWVDGKAQKGEAPAHADLAGLGRELVKPLVDTTEMVVGEGVVASAGPRRYRRDPRNRLCAVPRRPDASAQGREGVNGRTAGRSPSSARRASRSAAPIPAMPTRPTSPCWPRCSAALADKYGLKGETIDEVMGGAVIAHSRDFNLAREAALDAGLSPRTPGTNLQIACGTSLQAALMLGAKIASGEIESGIACGTDTVSRQPDRFRQQSSSTGWSISIARRTPQEKFAAFKGFSLGELTPVAPSTQEPRTGLSMGEHCELMARQLGHHPRGAGRTGAGQPPQRRQRL